MTQKFWKAVFASECPHYVQIGGWYDSPGGCFQCRDTKNFKWIGRFE